MSDKCTALNLGSDQSRNYHHGEVARCSCPFELHCIQWFVCPEYHESNRRVFGLTMNLLYTCIWCANCWGKYTDYWCWNCMWKRRSCGLWWLQIIIIERLRIIVGYLVKHWACLHTWHFNGCLNMYNHRIKGLLNFRCYCRYTYYRTWLDDCIWHFTS